MKQLRQSIRVGLILGVLTFLSVLMSPSNAKAQLGCNDTGAVRTIASFFVSPTTVIFGSTVTTVSITLNCKVVGDTYITGMLVRSDGPGGMFDYGSGCGCIRNGDTSGTHTIYFSAPPGNITLTAGFATSTKSVPKTINPLFPTISVSPSTVVGGSNELVTVTAPLNGPDIPGDPAGVGIRFSYTANGFTTNIDYFIPIPVGGQSAYLQIPNPLPTVGANNPSQAWNVNASLRGYGTNATLIDQPLQAQQPPNPPDLGSCGGGGGGGCLTPVGQPINLTNGNVWIAQRDYTLPGLGGGLELVRTWNSHWQDVSPPSNLGLFGHSWRSTYEESLAVFGSSSFQYWRADGSAWTFSNYNSVSHTYSVVSPPNEYASLHVELNGQFTMTMADGNQRIFDPAPTRRLIALIDRNQNQTLITYYSGTNHLQQVSNSAGSITFSYADSANPDRVSSVRDSVGVFGTYSYDTTTGHLTQVTYAANGNKTRVVRFNYDPSIADMISSVVDNVNGPSTTVEAHSYDSARNGTMSSLAKIGSGSAVEQVNVPNYSTFGITQVSDSISTDSPTTYGYQTIAGRNFVNSINGSGYSGCGGRGNQTLNYDTLGNVLSSTDALGNTTTFTYDTFGNVLTKSVQLNPATTYTWTYTYNPFQEVLTATDPLGNTTTNTYDTQGHGNLVTTTSPKPDPSTPASVTTFGYDPSGNGELTSITDPLLNVTHITYTPVGGSVPAGLIASIQDAQSNLTTFTYDARGNRKTVTDAAQNKTTFYYDVMNRLIQITRPGNSHSSYLTYDIRGRRLTAKDENSKITHYFYDDADRLNSVKDAANKSITYVYDTENRLKNIKDAMQPGRTTTFDYDPITSNVQTVTFPAGPIYKETYRYDAVGNLTSKKDRNANINNTPPIIYNYDSLYRLSSKQYGYDALHARAGNRRAAGQNRCRDDVFLPCGWTRLNHVANEFGWRSCAELRVRFIPNS